MTTFIFLLPFAAVAFSLLLAVASLFRKKPSPAAWCFFAGMAALALDSACTGMSLRADTPGEAADWLTRGLLIKSLVPGAWLAFSLTYSRGNYRVALDRWRLPLALVLLLPITLALLFQDHLVELVPATPPAEGIWLVASPATKLLNVVLLVGLVLALMNLEQTFRSAVGTMRWRIKYVILGVAVIFGAHIYVRSQAILYSVHDVGLGLLEPAALLIGCLFFSVAYLRSGWAEIDIYPSRDVLRSSLTVLIVGGYLFIVGVLAQVVRRFGGAEGFRVQAFVVLLGMAGLAVLLLSDRFRQRVNHFVARHFRKAQHDSPRIWTLFSQRLANVRDQAGLGAVTAQSISETFDVLSVTAWLLDEQEDQFVAIASTAPRAAAATTETGREIFNASTDIVAALSERPVPFDLEPVREPWADEWRRLNPSTFPNGGHRWCVPLRAGEKTLGALVLADRVSGVPYTAEERQLLQ